MFIQTNTYSPTNHYQAHLILACLLCWVVALAACSDAGSSQTSADGDRRMQIETMYRDYRRSFPEVSEIEPKQAMDLMKKEKVIFIDERKTAEQAVSMLPNSISAEAFLDDPSKYDGFTKIVYCTISYRSGMLALKKKSDGLDLINLRGGILAWVHDGGAVYDASGMTRRIHVYGPKWDLAPAAYEAVW